MDCPKEENAPIVVDGSFGEGGGQIIRNAVTLTVILKKFIKVINIRANRPNPGLASQHLESILAINKLSGATTPSTFKKGLTEFDLHGETVKEPIEEIRTTIDLITAGSVTLCVQCILPYLLTLRLPSHLKIIGGTHVMKAPNWDYLERVFIPTMTKLIGYNDVFEMQLLREGYFPRGGGSIRLAIKKPLDGLKFKHFNLLDRGRIISQTAIMNLTPRLHCCSEFNQFISAITKYIPRKSIIIRKVNYASIEWFSEFETGLAGFYQMAIGNNNNSKNPAPEDFMKCLEKIDQNYQEFIQSDATVDEMMQDQLIIYMALAKLSEPNGTSSIRSLELTDHTNSAIHIIQVMTGLKFNIHEERQQHPYKNTYVISI